jgi:hypothetical protein
VHVSCRQLGVASEIDVHVFECRADLTNYVIMSDDVPEELCRPVDSERRRKTTHGELVESFLRTRTQHTSLRSTSYDERLLFSYINNCRGTLSYVRVRKVYRV